MLSQWLERKGGANLDDREERFVAVTGLSRLKPEDAAPLIAELLELPLGERYPPSR
jgi:hypothetical protein